MKNFIVLTFYNILAIFHYNITTQILSTFIRIYLLQNIFVTTIIIKSQTNKKIQ